LKDGNESREKKGDTSLTQEDSDDDENQIEICSGGKDQLQCCVNLHQYLVISLCPLFQHPVMLF
jgi:hypothetical protein